MQGKKLARHLFGLVYCHKSSFFVWREYQLQNEDWSSFFFFLWKHMFLHFYKKFVYTSIEKVQACNFARIKSAEFWDLIWIQYIHIVCLRVRQRIGAVLTILAITNAIHNMLCVRSALALNKRKKGRVRKIFLHFRFNESKWI